MATRHIATIEAMTDTLIRSIGDHPDVRELWVATRSGIPWFWLITADIDDEAERTLFGNSAAVYDEVDGALFDLHIVNPRNYVEGTDPRSIVPSDARLIVTFRS